MARAFSNALGQLIIGNTLHIKAVFSVFGALKNLQKERNSRVEKATGKTLLSVLQVKQVIDDMTHINAKEVVHS
jgi:hypothetical protein